MTLDKSDLENGMKQCHLFKDRIQQAKVFKGHTY